MMEEINMRLKQQVAKIISEYINETNEFESFNQDFLKFSKIIETDYNDLIQHMDTLNTNCNNVLITNNSMAKTITEKNCELKTSQTNLNDFEIKYNSLLKELERLQDECTNIKEKEKSSVDKTILDLSAKKLKLYGQITNIKWDYSVPLASGKAIGYVSNKEGKYIHAFELKKNGMLENLWKNIEQSSEVWEDIIAMTNLNITN